MSEASGVYVLVVINGWLVILVFFFRRCPTVEIRHHMPYSVVYSVGTSEDCLVNGMYVDVAMTDDVSHRLSDKGPVLPFHPVLCGRFQE